MKTYLFVINSAQGTQYIISDSWNDAKKKVGARLHLFERLILNFIKPTKVENND